MGFLKERYGIEMIGKVPEGACPECAVKHDRTLPHNKQSITYQYNFYNKNGRWPTWKDAMEHCNEEMKKFWINELRGKGVEVEE